ncbi:MAG: DNA repair protein RecN [Proteobacteria bacterium]|nr:DNA repair protein RecN [Pseudomonadota bacterium]
MLLSISLKSFVIVQELSLDFRSGLTTLTGETGAGKSIVIDALGLLLGGRAESAVVRHGAEKADLQARFAPPKNARAWLEEEALLGEEPDELLIRRSIDSNGKSRAWINGISATLTQLKTLGEQLVDIHGQHAPQSLLRSEVQRELVDGYAECTCLARDVAGLFKDWKNVVDELAIAENNAEAFDAERERLQWQVDEVAALQFTAAEWPELQAEHKRLHHAASLIEGVQSGLLMLADGDENCQSWLGSVAGRLSALADFDAGISETLELLASAEAQMSEAVYALRRYSDHLELDPARLADVESRLDAIFRMARKYRVEPAELPEKLAAWQNRLAELGGSAGLDAVRRRAQKLEADYRKAAKLLSASRKAAADKLSKMVTKELQLLALVGSRFEIALHAHEAPASFGLETVEFMVANHPTTPARAMAKVASGGELSRISLALQVITSQVANVPTLIFDEVDVGIGGRVAEIVGRMLADLGAARQVLCITHLPQVAACGFQQLQVSKTQSKTGVLSTIHMLSVEERIEEIARMLGGVEITGTTRQHAAEMLGVA